MISLHSYASETIRMEFCKFLAQGGAKLRVEDSADIARLFCLLICDNNPWIQQFACESFESFTLACLQDNLITSVAYFVRNSQTDAANILPNYISSINDYYLYGFTDLKSFLNSVDYLSAHICYSRSERLEKVQKIEIFHNNGAEDRIKNSEYEEFEKNANNIRKNIDALSKNKKYLKRETIDELRLSFDAFLKGGE